MTLSVDCTSSYRASYTQIFGVHLCLGFGVLASVGVALTLEMKPTREAAMHPADFHMGPIHNLFSTSMCQAANLGLSTPILQTGKLRLREVK